MLGRVLHVAGRFLIWMSGGLIVLLFISVIYNLTLPEKSKLTEILPEVEKVRLAEAMHLQRTLGDSVWPGWSRVPIPFMVYNEKYVFIVDYPDPPEGWFRIPGDQFRGKQWEIVPDDIFLGKTYYRQHLPDKNITPECFTVKVGDSWVATMQTYEYAEIEFYGGFRQDLPKFMAAVFPFKIFWKMLMGSSDKYIGALTHESFHAFQGTVSPQRLEKSQKLAGLADNYPWDDSLNIKGWKEEIGLLIHAYRSVSDSEAVYFTGRFLTKRNERRSNAGLHPEMVNYEREREWLEGLAKYAEYQSVCKPLKISIINQY
jgi:hypothetical protein